jgi:hypothetical protein
MCGLGKHSSLQIFCLEWQLAQLVLDLWLYNSALQNRMSTRSTVFRGDFFCFVFLYQTPTHPNSALARLLKCGTLYVSTSAN